jgi:hypothetical protein
LQATGLDKTFAKRSCLLNNITNKQLLNMALKDLNCLSITAASKYAPSVTFTDLLPLSDISKHH